MVTTEDVITLRVNLIAAKGDLSKSLFNLNKGALADTDAAMKKVAGEQQVVYQNQRKLNQELDRQAGKPTPFAGWAMSIMFAGMAIQRLGKQVQQFGTKAFKEISESVAGSTTNVTILEGSMKYLGYQIGSALEPILGILIPIIDKISEWVEENPKLTASLIALSVVLGTLFFVGGSGMLAYNGFKDLATIIGKTVPNAANTLKNYDWKSLGNTISSGIGMIAIGYGIYEAAEGIADITNGKFLEGTLKALGGTLTTVGGFKLIMGKGGMPLILIGAAITLVGEAKLFKSVESVGALIFAILASSLEMLGGVVFAVLMSPLTLVLSLIKSAYGGLGKSAPSWINKYLDRMNESTGETMQFGANFDKYYQGSLTGWGSQLDTSISNKLAKDAPSTTAGFVNNGTINVSNRDFERLTNTTKVNATGG